MLTKHSPQIELISLRNKLSLLDETCVHWDYEDENPDCAHAEERDKIRTRIRTLKKQIAKE